MKNLTIDTTDKKLKEALDEFVINGKINFRYKGIVSNILAEYIVENIDTRYIKTMVEDNVLKKEPEVYEYFERNIKKYINRKLRIYDMLMDYIKNNNYLNFEGFVRFRLKDYYNSIEKIIREISREYRNESEYRKFISIIKDFIKAQTSIVSNLSIYKNSDGKYLIFDDYYNDITEICEKEFIDEFGFCNLSRKTLVLNTILMLAPETVTFHKCSRIEDFDIMNAVSDVYENEMHNCQNCILCQRNK